MVDHDGPGIRAFHEFVYKETRIIATVIVLLVPYTQLMKNIMMSSSWNPFVRKIRFECKTIQGSVNIFLKKRFEVYVFSEHVPGSLDMECLGGIVV